VSKRHVPPPNPLLLGEANFRRGEIQGKITEDADAWRPRTLELEKGHKKDDNTVRSSLK